MGVDQPVDALALALALLRDDAVQLRVGGREGDEVADEELCRRDLVDAPQPVDAGPQCRPELKW